MRIGDVPKEVRYLPFLGVDIAPAGGSQWRGDCPLCGKERHLFANGDSGLWDCKVCGESGNQTTFMRKVHAAASAATTREQLRELSHRRGIPSGVLREAGLARLWTGEWLIPVTSGGALRDLRKYDGRQLLSTPGCKAQLWGADELAAAPGAEAYLMEGEWDGLAMRWMLRDAGRAGLAVPVAVPGATTLKDEWVDLFQGRRVTTFYDADDAGDKGQLKAEERLRPVASRLLHVCWPDSAPSGWDARDHARSRVAEAGAGGALDELLAMAGDRTRRRAASDGSGPAAVQPSRWTEAELPETDFAGVVETFRRYLVLGPDAELALKLMLAVALSNDVDDDPLWLYVIAPPSTGKTELLSQFQESSRCVFVSSVTPHGLVSGWRGEGKSDPSLIPKLRGKTLVAKDFTEILAMPEFAQNELYSILRGAYDGFVDRVYGNGVVRKYRDCHFSILAGSTQAIRLKRNSALGERFLQFEMPAVSAAEEEERCLKAIDMIGRRREKSDEMGRAVCAFLKRKVDPAALPAFPRERQLEVVRLARLVAAMRTDVMRNRYTSEIEVRMDRESATRLTKQLAKLASLLAVIDGAGEVSKGNVREVARVALDTVGGFSLDVLQALMGMGGRGTKRDVAESCRLTPSTVGRRVDDMVYTGVLEPVAGAAGTGSRGGRPAAEYAVRAEVRELWQTAMGQSSTSTSMLSGTLDGRASDSSSGGSPSGSAVRHRARSRTVQTPTRRVSRG